MEAVNGRDKQSGILSLINREKDEYPNHSHSYSSTTMAATVAMSPSFPYPNDPPPRYEASAAYAGHSSSLHGIISHLEPRRTPEKTETVAPLQPRQSLPSIHEALRPSSTYPSPPSASLPTPTDLTFSKSQVAATPSLPRSYPPTEHPHYTSHLPPPPPPPPRQRTPPVQTQPLSASLPRPEVSSAAYAEISRHPSIPSHQAGPPGPHHSHLIPRYDPTRYEQDTRASERTPGAYHQPPSSQPTYTYGSGPTAPPSTQQPSVFSQPRYQPREFRDILEPWKNEKVEPSQQVRVGIKRNLDVYDFENALHQLNFSSSALAEWSAHYKAIASEQQRSVSILPERMPDLDSIKAMIRHQEKIAFALENMTRIINEAQQQSERAMIEQRSNDAAGRQGEFDEESMYGDDSKNHGFNSEGKKRRGRAAPPGRCHSCNRAETPEWRRGPDGARTLCNACGLHYAKLTRKNTQNKISQNPNGSSLRPKSLDEVSPRPL